MYFGFKVISYSKNDTKKFTSYISTAKAIIIGTGASLSSRAGFYLSGESFIIFFDFKKKYNIHDMYLGSFYPYSQKQNIGLLCLVIYI